MQEQLQKDFSFNVEDFAVNKYAKLVRIDGEATGEWERFAFGDRVSKNAPEHEMERRCRWLAQKAMTHRANEAMKAIQESAIDIQIGDAISIADAIQTPLLMVYSPESIEYDGDGSSFSKAEKPLLPEINASRVSENTVRIRSAGGPSLTAEYLIPRGHVLLIPFGSVEIRYFPSYEMRVDTEEDEDETKVWVCSKFGVKIATKPFRLKV